MSTTVSYKGATIATVSNDTKTLLTEGKYLEDDITLVDVSGGGAVLTTKNISANGTYNASSDSADGYSQVNVSVPASAVDSGTKNITANGNNQDVVGYAAVNVNVPNSYSAGDEGKVVSNGALVAQGSDTVTENDTYDTTLINSLTVNVSGGGEDREDLTIPKDVDFIDFDGRLLYSYTAQEFAALSEMPANPSYSGLTAQGWNWTLADAKPFVAEHGALVIGQNYVTSDGKTKIYVNIPQTFIDYSITMAIYIIKVSTPSGTIDWGDGHTDSFPSGNSISHQYSQAGDYVINITVSSGTIRLGYAGANQTLVSEGIIRKLCVQKVEIGSGVVGLGRNAFFTMNNLRSVSIPTTCVSHDTGNDEGMFSGRALRGIVFPADTPGQNTRILGNNSEHNVCMRYIAIPKTMTGFIMATPQMHSLRKLTFYNYTTSTKMDTSLYNAACLTHFVCPGTYTTIEADKVRSSLIKKLTIPSTVTSVGSLAFAYNNRLEELHFKPTSPPTIGSNAFRELPATCVIYVPYSSDHSVLNAYKATTNISAFAAQMQEEPQ